MNSYEHTWSGERLTQISDVTSTKPAELAETMLASGPACLHVEVTGKKYAGGAVNACVALCRVTEPGTNVENWRWRAEVFSELVWVKWWSIEERLIQNHCNDKPPVFEIAIVPFTRAWSEIVSRTWRVSLWREYARLAQGLDAYDEHWQSKLNAGKMQGRMQQHLIGPDDGWGEREMQQWLAAMRLEWLKTPEGFFEARSKKNAHR